MVDSTFKVLGSGGEIEGQIKKKSRKKLEKLAVVFVFWSVITGGPLGKET